MAFDDKTGRADVSAVPLYQQVMDDLKGEIARGVYAAGSRIPAEMELAKSYGVGRVTVRRAIEELSRAGYLNRQQGGVPLCALPSSSARFARRVTSRALLRVVLPTTWCRVRVWCRARWSRRRTRMRRSLAWSPAASLSWSSACARPTASPVMLENNAFVLADHPYLQTLADKDLTDNSIFCARCRAFGSRAASSPTPAPWRLRLPMLRRPRCWRCRSVSRSSIWRRTLPTLAGAPTARPPKDRGLALRLRHLTSTDRTT